MSPPQADVILLSLALLCRSDGPLVHEWLHQPEHVSFLERMPLPSNWKSAMPHGLCQAIEVWQWQDCPLALKSVDYRHGSGCSRLFRLETGWYLLRSSPRRSATSGERYIRGACRE